MHKKDLIAVSILSVLTILYFFSLLFLNHVLYMGDNISLILPYKTYIAQEFYKGNIPLWNPYILSGTPFFADISAGTLYISNVLYLLFEPLKALSYTVILHILFCGVCFYFLAKQYKFSFIASLLSALLYMFSGTTLQLSQNTAALEVLTWLPFSVLMIEKYFMSRNIIFASLFILSIVLQFFAGHFQFFYYNFIFYVVYVLFKIQNPVKTKIFFILFTSVFFLLISSIQLLPFLEFSQYSTRPVGDYTYATASFPAINLVHLVFANFFGVQKAGTSWGAQANIAGYIGVIPLLLVAFLFLNDRKREYIFFGLVVLIALALAIGYYSPVYYIAFHIIPFFNRFRSPTSILTIYTFALCVLSGYAFDHFINVVKNSVPFSRYSQSFIIFLFLGISIILITKEKLYSFMYVSVEWLYSVVPFAVLKKFIDYNDNRLEIIFLTWKNNILGIALLLLIFFLCVRFYKYISLPFFICMIFILCIIDPLVVSRNAYMTTAYDFTAVTVPLKKDNNSRIYTLIDPPERPPFGDEHYYLQEAVKQYIYLKPNTNMIEGIYSVDGYASIINNAYARYISPNGKSVTSIILNKFPSSTINTLGIKYLLTSEKNKNLLNDSYKLVNSYKDKYMSHRYYVYENLRTEPRAYLIKNNIKEPLRIQEDTGEYIKLAFPSKTRGTVVLHDTFYTGWYAKANGNILPIEKYQNIFKAIHLNEQVQTIELFYEPWAYRLGKLITIISLLLLSFTTIVFKHRFSKSV